ncbi:MAG: LytTR family transcriptional regulator [Chitinophagaceae bacterium]|nr:LytTR family transcriptional regulator [Chitinophagaceae bacterium]
MQIIVLDEETPESANFVAGLQKVYKQVKISPQCDHFKDCIRWLQENIGEIPAELYGGPKYKSRVVVKWGKEYQTLKVADIVCFFTDHKVVFAVDKENKKFLFEKGTLENLEKKLDKNMFFRVNRKYILNADYIKSFKPVSRYRISVQVMFNVAEEIIVSQDNSANFRRWISEN